MNENNYLSPTLEIWQMHDDTVLCQSSGEFSGNNEIYIEENLI